MGRALGGGPYARLRPMRVRARRRLDPPHGRRPAPGRRPPRRGGGGVIVDAYWTRDLADGGIPWHGLSEPVTLRYLRSARSAGNCRGYEMAPPAGFEPAHTAPEARSRNLPDLRKCMCQVVRRGCCGDGRGRGPAGPDGLSWKLERISQNQSQTCIKLDDSGQFCDGDPS